MAIEKVEATQCICERCGHRWLTMLKGGAIPVECTKCKSTGWNRPRRIPKGKKTPPEVVEAVKDAIEGVPDDIKKPTEDTEELDVVKAE